jgi:hypothetical protein
MLILFVASPGLGHINPMLPLARAMKDRGHEVQWAVAAEFVGYLERMGFPAHAAGLGHRQISEARPRSRPSSDGSARRPWRGAWTPSQLNGPRTWWCMTCRTSPLLRWQPGSGYPM